MTENSVIYDTLSDFSPSSVWFASVRNISVNKTDMGNNGKVCAQTTSLIKCSEEEFTKWLINKERAN